MTKVCSEVRKIMNTLSFFLFSSPLVYLFSFPWDLVQANLTAPVQLKIASALFNIFQHLSVLHLSPEHSLISPPPPAAGLYPPLSTEWLRSSCKYLHTVQFFTQHVSKIGMVTTNNYCLVPVASHEHRHNMSVYSKKERNDRHADIKCMNKINKQKTNTSLHNWGDMSVTWKKPNNNSSFKTILMTTPTNANLLGLQARCQSWNEQDASLEWIGYSIQSIHM